jgi:uroporphyrin-III C-methyltransferase
MSLLNEPLQFGPPVAAARVTLVGAGPGDPELLTLKAARALQAARLVLYDHLVSKEVLELLPKSADRIYVGKEAGCHTLTQEGIIDLMIRLARAGKPVLRLKGGDPFIFGRGGEEAQALAANGIPFDVIPGISAAQGAAACAGIPLTHRDHAGTLVFVTGHACARAHGKGDAGGEASVDLDWPMLARPNQTVVIYMGVATLPLICAKLIEHGLNPGTPAALIERATLPTQRNVIGSVQTLPTLALIHDVRAPALVLIGGVVGLHRQLGAVQVRHELHEAHEPMRSPLAL